jgi:murein DD-endopeptidase MepM/ murein hydrolase activator NlpD
MIFEPSPANRKTFLSLLGIFAILWAAPSLRAEERPVGPPLLALEYGINCDPYEVRREIVQPGQNLSGILLEAGVPYGKIDKAVRKCDGVFDVRRIRIGNPYSLIGNPCSPDGIRYFVYERSPTDFVVMDLGERVDVFAGSKPVSIRARAVSGVIESSLWNAFKDAGVDFDLALGLADIYAWTLDFFHFQKDDRFSFVVEEKRVDGRVVGYGRILAARILHRDRPRYAFYFEARPGEGDYFDENGESLRQAFLKAPLKYVRISSQYSRSRLHPILNEYKPHLGIDYAAPEGTPVLAVGDGVVEKAEYNRSMGRYLQIRHNHQYMTQYLHLSRFAEGIAVGTRVRQGDEIGSVGSTGLATGPHLDFRFWDNGKAVDFLEQELPVADAVSAKQRDRFERAMAEFRFDLDDDGRREFSAEIQVDREEG